MKVRTTSDMRSFIKGILQNRILELKNVADPEKSDECGEKQLRIFIDECIKLTVEQNCFSEEEMISESLTMLIAVS